MRPPAALALRFALRLTIVGSLAVPAVAAAQESELPPPPPPPPTDRPVDGASLGGDRGRGGVAPARVMPPSRPVAALPGVPPPRRGFQIAARTGIAIPTGSLERGSAMSDAFGVQLPLLVDIGAKPIPALFIGGYIGLGVGSSAGALESACDTSGVSCRAFSFRIGPQIQWHVLPEGKINPWLGYGFGYELAGVSGSRGPVEVQTTVGGFEYAHVTAGLDFRLSRVVGVGPVLDYSLGQYEVGSTARTVARAGGAGGTVVERTDGDIANPAIHQWLMLGARVVFFP